MFSPKPEQFSQTPTPGMFYQVVYGDTPSGIAQRAFGSTLRRSGLMAMNDSAWNRHIAHGPKGWEVYQIDGLQLLPQYDSTNPGSAAGSGRAFPVIWIPTTEKAEPDDVFGPQAPIPVPRPSPIVIPPKVKPIIDHIRHRIVPIVRPAAPVPTPEPKWTPIHKPPVSPVKPIGRYEKDRYDPRRPIDFSTNPTPGRFYQVARGDTPIWIAKEAYGSDSRVQGLFLVNLSSWNDHVQRATKGWEAYGMAGLQLNAVYDPMEPRSYWNTGNAYPVLWIPPSDGEEPEEYFGKKQPAIHHRKPISHGKKPGQPGQPGQPDQPGRAESKKDPLGNILTGVTIAAIAVKASTL